MDRSVRKARAIGCIIINQERKTLILQRNPSERVYPGKWELPSGKIEAGESIKKALEREVTEETGLRVRLPFFRWPTSILRYTISDASGIRKTKQKNYLIEVMGTPQVKLSPEHVAFAWVKPSELPRYDLIQNVENMILAGYKRQVQRKRFKESRQRMIHRLKRLVRRVR